VHTIKQWRARTGESRSTVLERIQNGELKAIKTGKKTSPWRIATSEYVRLGFIQSLDDLL